MASITAVTTMFTDLVDSTAVSTRLGPEAAAELREVHYGLLKTAVAATGGSEVKSTGDGLMVVFPSPSAALKCAVAIQQAIERHNREASERLSVRIGVSHGEAEPYEGDYYGDSVVEAARLCAAAQGGQILASDVVRVLVGARGSRVFRSVGSLELKGLAQPVATVEVGWAPLSGGEALAAPLPVRVDRAAQLRLVGRSEELEILRGWWKDVEGRERRVVLVGGEAGIGKTTLVARIAADAHATGAVVLYGRCDEELGIPYQPWVEALGHLVDHASHELLVDHVTTFGGEIARLCPDLHRVVADVPDPSASDAETVRYELFGAVVGLLNAAAALAPVFVVLDDLHWADKQTLLLLRQVVARTVSERLFIVGTYRDIDLTETHPLPDALAALRREVGVERMALRGLEDGDMVALVELAGC